MFVVAAKGNSAPWTRRAERCGAIGSCKEDTATHKTDGGLLLWSWEGLKQPAHHSAPGLLLSHLYFKLPKT